MLETRATRKKNYFGFPNGFFCVRDKINKLFIEVLKKTFAFVENSQREVPPLKLEKTLICFKTTNFTTGTTCNPKHIGQFPWRRPQNFPTFFFFLNFHISIYEMFCLSLRKNTTLWSQRATVGDERRSTTVACHVTQTLF